MPPSSWKVQVQGERGAAFAGVRDGLRRADTARGDLGVLATPLPLLCTGAALTQTCLWKTTLQIQPHTCVCQCPSEKQPTEAYPPGPEAHPRGRDTVTMFLLRITLHVLVPAVPRLTFPAGVPACHTSEAGTGRGFLSVFRTNIFTEKRGSPRSVCQRVCSVGLSKLGLQQWPHRGSVAQRGAQNQDSLARKSAQRVGQWPVPSQQHLQPGQGAWEGREDGTRWEGTARVLRTRDQAHTVTRS